jgi:hypothetical protein
MASLLAVVLVYRVVPSESSPRLILREKDSVIDRTTVINTGVVNGGLRQSFAGRRGAATCPAATTAPPRTAGQGGVAVPSKCSQIFG